MTKRRNPAILTSMEHFRSKLTALVLLLLVFTTAQAGHTLYDLDMTVSLADNGNARITEVRHMDVGTDGTECYIVIGNLGSSEVHDLTVSDETGREFTNIGSWDIDASRSQKAGRCGIVYKSDGYELCWGLGDSGDRTYTVSYTVTRMVRGYDDADGFNFMFVTPHIKPSAEHAKITFVREDGKEIPQDQVKMWAFRYQGTVNWEDGTVVAETTESMSGDEAMIVMLRFEKDFLHPEVAESGSFDQLKDKAFEDSDYNDGDGFEWDSGIITVLLFIILSPFLIGYYLIRVWWFRHQAKKDLLWFRDLPYGGDLKRSYEVLEAYSYGKYDQKNIISALVLKLISMKALAIEDHWVNPTGFAKLTGGSPKLKKLIAIKPLIADKDTPTLYLLKKLHSMFLKAAGDDGVLQPKELERWMNYNTSEVESFINMLKPQRSLKACSKDMKNVREVLGMKLFLQDFTLADQRHATEVALWKDYLVFAELFGIADQVRKDMKQINPEYLKMDEIFRQLNNTDVLPAVTLATLSGIHDVQKEQSGSSGGGGWASSGGGGGFSGGGSGGGVR